MDAPIPAQMPKLSGPDVLSLIALNPKTLIANRVIVLDAPLVLNTNDTVMVTTCHIHASDSYDPSNIAPLVTLEGTGENLRLIQNYVVNPHGPVINDDIDLKFVQSNLFETGAELAADKRGWWGTNVNYNTDNPVPQEELDATMPEELKPCETLDDNS